MTTSMLLRARCFATCVMLALCVDAGAELAKPLTLDELAAMADTIVHARCTRIETQWRNGKVFTTAHFDVVDDLGETGLTQINITSPGGTAVHPMLNVSVTTRLSDAIPMQVQDEVILFARQHGAQDLRLLAGGQSYLKIYRDTDGIDKVQTRERAVVATPLRAQRGGESAATQLSAKVYALSAYKQRVQESRRKSNRSR